MNAAIDFMLVFSTATIGGLIGGAVGVFATLYWVFDRP